MTCATGSNFDLTASAGQFAGLSSLLAGFAFAALILVVQRHEQLGAAQRMPKEGRERSDGSIQPLLVNFLCSFIALVVATLLYALVSADVEPLQRTTTLNLLASAAFGIAVLLLLFGLVQLFAHAGLRHTARFASRLVSVLMPALVVVYMWATALDATICDQQLTSGDLEINSTSEGLVLFGAGAGGILLGLLSAMLARAPVRQLASRAQLVGPAALALVGALAVASGLAQVESPDLAISDSGLALLLCGVGVVLGLYARIVLEVARTAQ